MPSDQFLKELRVEHDKATRASHGIHLNLAIARTVDGRAQYNDVVAVQAMSSGMVRVTYVTEWLGSQKRDAKTSSVISAFNLMEFASVPVKHGRPDLSLFLTNGNPA